MAIGEASGENRAIDAVQIAIASPLLDIDISGARGVLFNITGGTDLTLFEVNDAADVISRAAHPEANIIFGAVQDPSYDGKVKITVIATGFDGQQGRVPHAIGVPQVQQKSPAYDRSGLYTVASSSMSANNNSNANMPVRQQPQQQQHGYAALPVTPPPMNAVDQLQTDPMRQRPPVPSPSLPQDAPRQ